MLSKLFVTKLRLQSRNSITEMPTELICRLWANAIWLFRMGYKPAALTKAQFHARKLCHSYKKLLKYCN